MGLLGIGLFFLIAMMFVVGNVLSARERNHGGSASGRGLDDAADLSNGDIARAHDDLDVEGLVRNEELSLPHVNVDGTPMIPGTHIDVHGHAYGCTD